MRIDSFAYQNKSFEQSKAGWVDSLLLPFHTFLFYSLPYTFFISLRIDFKNSNIRKRNSFYSHLFRAASTAGILYVRNLSIIHLSEDFIQNGRVEDRSLDLLSQSFLVPLFAFPSFQFPFLLEYDTSRLSHCSFSYLKELFLTFLEPLSFFVLFYFCSRREFLLYVVFIKVTRTCACIFVLKFFLVGFFFLIL